MLDSMRSDMPIVRAYGANNATMNRRADFEDNETIEEFTLKEI